MVPGASDKIPVRVTIFNQSYTLLASGDAGETESLAHQVDELMNRIASRGGNIDSTRTAVLTALHLADQLRSLERELNGLKQRVEERSKQLSVLLDQAVSAE
jgi:cell division protein ZapA